MVKTQKPMYNAKLRGERSNNNTKSPTKAKTTDTVDRERMNFRFFTNILLGIVEASLANLCFQTANQLNSVSLRVLSWGKNALEERAIYITADLKPKKSRRMSKFFPPNLFSI